MSNNDRLQELLEELARRVGDGQAVDWEDVKRDLDPTTEGLVGLEAVATIAKAFESTRGPTEEEEVQPALFDWGSLTVLEEIGEGSFGTVYRAYDGNLDREVALKLRRIQDGEGLEAGNRFVAEAKRLARVRHPNVVVVHGADQWEERTGMWTDLIEGKTLVDLVQDLGTLGPGEVANIGRDLASALAAVHEAGLLHGDVKPANVMREVGGRVVLMDFGAGVEWHGAQQETQLTRATAVTAAPEVLRGESATPATDIYSLGAVLYFLLTGKYPVEGLTLEEVREGHEAGVALDLSLASKVPPALSRVIETCLAPDPAHRFQTAADLERALRATWESDGRSRPRPVRPWLVAAALGAVALAAVMLGRRDPEPEIPGLQVREGQAILAILPLVTDESGLAEGEAEREIDLLSLAITDYLGARLEGVADLVVLDPDEVARFLPDPTVKAIREAIDPDFILEGRLDSTDGPGRALLSGRIVRRNGVDYSLRRQHFALPDIPNDFALLFNARQALVEEVVAVVSPQSVLPLDGAKGEIAPQDPSLRDPEVFRVALSADRILRSTLCDDQGLEQQLQSALSRSPASAHLWWLLGNHYFTRVWGCGDSIALLDRAFSAAQRADEIAPGRYEAMTQLRHTFLLETNRAEEAFDAALQAKPSNADALYRLSLTLRYAGFLDAAALYRDELLELEPLYFFEGRYGRAPNGLLYSGDWGEFIERIPISGPYHSYYDGFVKFLGEDREGARAVLESAFRDFPSDMFGSLSRALLAVVNGEDALAVEIVRQVATDRNRLPLRDGEVTYKQAQLLALAGDEAESLRALDETVEQGFFCVRCFESDPALKSLRLRPEYQEIVERARGRHERFAGRFGLQSEADRGTSQ